MLLDEIFFIILLMIMTFDFKFLKFLFILKNKDKKIFFEVLLVLILKII